MSNRECNITRSMKGCDLVLDIQHFKDKNGDFLPKEVVVGAIQKKPRCLAGWLVALPHDIKELPASLHRENTWRMENHHGIHWSEGDISVDCLRKELSKIFNEVGAALIYSRGHRAVKFLGEITNHRIINLDSNQHFPSTADPSPLTAICPWHGRQQQQNGYPIIYHCALQNVKKKAMLFKLCFISQ